MRKIIPVVLAGATALAVAGGTFGYATMDKDVTLSLDGQSGEVSTFAGTVGDLLADQGVAVSERDVVAPGLDARLREGSRVAVQFARQVTVSVDGRPQTFWTTATTVGDAVKSLTPNADRAALSTSRSAGIGRQGIRLSLATEKKVVVKAGGKQRTITTTAQTVREVLAAAKVTVDGNDKVSSAQTSRVKNGSAITVTKVDVDRETKKVDVDFDTVERESDDLLQGTTRVDVEGQDGTRRVTYRVVRHDGKVESRQKTGSKITDQPVDKVVLVGTREPEPEPEPEPEDTESRESDQSESSQSESDQSESDQSESDQSESDQSESQDGGSAPEIASGGVWDRLAECESGGNWSINTGNGYYGGLQFTLSTWRANGGTGMPHQASRERQIAVAKRVQASQGWGAWPACTSKLGIR